MNLSDNRLSPEKRINAILVEVRQQIGGASTGPDNLFSCLLMLRNALLAYIESDPNEMDGMYSTRCNVLGNARDHMERAINRYGMNIFSQFLPVLESIGKRKHGW